MLGLKTCSFSLEARASKQKEDSKALLSGSAVVDTILNATCDPDLHLLKQSNRSAL